MVVDNISVWIFFCEQEVTDRVVRVNMWCFPMESDLEVTLQNLMDQMQQVNYHLEGLAGVKRKLKRDHQVIFLLSVFFQPTTHTVVK